MSTRADTQTSSHRNSYEPLSLHYRKPKSNVVSKHDRKHFKLEELPITK